MDAGVLFTLLATRTLSTTLYVVLLTPYLRRAYFSSTQRHAGEHVEKQLGTGRNYFYSYLVRLVGWRMGDTAVVISYDVYDV